MTGTHFPEPHSRPLNPEVPCAAERNYRAEGELAMRPLRQVLAGLPLALRAAERLADPDWHPPPEQAAEAQHALAQAPSCPQSNLFGEMPS